MIYSISRLGGRATWNMGGEMGGQAVSKMEKPYLSFLIWSFWKAMGLCVGLWTTIFAWPGAYSLDCTNMLTSWSKISSLRMFVIVITPGLIWHGLRAYDVRSTWWGALLPAIIESAVLSLCLPLNIIPSSPTGTGIYCFKCHRSWYEGWEEEMGLLGSWVTVRFGELCSFPDPAEPLARRALRWSHTFLKETIASHVPECMHLCFCDIVFLCFICVDQS